MPSDTATLIHAFVTASFIVSILIASSMIWRAPKDVDRMVALEWIGGISISLVAYYALKLGDMKLIDIALILATLGYLSTAFFSRWYEEKELH